MNKSHILLTIIAISVLGLTSCKKYTCNCTAEYSDPATGTYTSTTEAHTVKAVGILKAETKCSEYNESSTYMYKTCSVIY